MPRKLDEWIGKTDDASIPDRVKARVFLKYEGLCCQCERKIGGIIGWECDHTVALINGGENRESNLQILCSLCHLEKTVEDLAIKSKTYAMQKGHLGLKKPRWKPLPGTKRSGIRKRMSGRVEKW